MDIKKRLGKNIAALLLLVALMLPAVVQFVHAFEGHDHVACTEQTTHFHKTAENCSICEFHLATFNYTIDEYPEFATFIIPTSLEKQLVAVRFHSFKITNTQLRAPPYFLS